MEPVRNIRFSKEKITLIARIQAFADRKQWSWNKAAVALIERGLKK